MSRRSVRHPGWESIDKSTNPPRHGGTEGMLRAIADDGLRSQLGRSEIGSVALWSRGLVADGSLAGSEDAEMMSGETRFTGFVRSAGQLECISHPECPK